MGPKVRFTREQIVEAAFDIAQAEGLDHVTMRKIAERMGSSVAPIYANFADSNELTEALLEKIVSVSRELLATESTGHPFADIGRASLRFAKEYSVLFRDLVLKRNDYLKGYDERMVPTLIAELQRDPELADFTEDELKAILLKMKVFQLGLSVMVANDLLKGYGERDLMGLLSSAADDVIVSARLRTTTRPGGH